MGNPSGAVNSKMNFTKGILNVVFPIDVQIGVFVSASYTTRGSLSLRNLFSTLLLSRTHVFILLSSLSKIQRCPQILLQYFVLEERLCNEMYFILSCSYHFDVANLYG